MIIRLKDIRGQNFHISRVLRITMSKALIQTDALLKQLTVILRPIIRLAIRRGVSFPNFSELLKAIYVQVADQEFTLTSKNQTDSRLSVITGVHRKEIKRLRELGTYDVVIPRSASLSSLLISRWLTDPDFSSPDGVPRPLPRSRTHGVHFGFDDLVERVTKDVRPRAIFDDWLNRGIITVQNDGSIRLLVEVYGPNGEEEEKLYYFGRNLRDHIQAAVANISDDPGAPFFERAVHYDGLGEDLSKDMAEFSNAAAMKILKQVNSHAREAVDTDEQDPGEDTSWRFTLGVYVFREKKPGGPLGA